MSRLKLKPDLCYADFNCTNKTAPPAVQGTRWCIVGHGTGMNPDTAGSAKGSDVCGQTGGLLSECFGCYNGSGQQLSAGVIAAQA